MAAAPVVSYEAYQTMSAIYLTLLRQLETATGENKWLEIGPPDDPVALQEKVRQAIAPLKLDESSILYSDYQKTQQFVLDGSRVDRTEMSALGEYLRETGMRYAVSADAMLPADAE